MLTTSIPDGAVTVLPDSRAMGVGTTRKERRTSTRFRNKVPTKLAPLGRDQVHRCHAEDISTGGLFVRVPAEYGLSVGQRVEVVLGDDKSPASSSGVAGMTCYATVVRTRQLVDQQTRVIGAGLRFDHPIFLEPCSQLTGREPISRSHVRAS